MRGITRVYTSTDRDSLLASMLDGVRASGNRDIFIKMKTTRRGIRIGPFSAFIDDEVEALHLKFLNQFPPGISLVELVTRFNVNIPYSGIVNAVSNDVRIIFSRIFAGK
jgi:DnaJ family protein C protein 13